MYAMANYGFPTGPGGYASGRILPTSQNPGLGRMVRSGNYMGSIGRVHSLRVSAPSSRGIDLAAIGLGTGLGTTPVDAEWERRYGSGSASASSSGGFTWGNALDFFTVAVQGAPGIINAARDDSSSAVVPATDTGPGQAYYQAELERLRQAQVDSRQQATLPPASIVPGVSNGMLLLGAGLLGVGAIVTVSLLKKKA